MKKIVLACLGLFAVLLFVGGMPRADRVESGSVTSRLFGQVQAADHDHAGVEGQKYTCGMHPMVIADEPGDCPICGMALTPLKAGSGGAASSGGERKIKYWAAPMDPTYIRKEPGKSPMGMDLVPVYEDQVSSGSVVSVDPVTAQNMGIRTEKVERRDLSRTIRTLGLVAYDEARQYSINSKIDGWVEKLHVNETGQMVRQGQPLLDIYSPELVSAQQEFLLALGSQRRLAASPFPEIAEGARRLLEASRERLRYWDISDRQIERLEQRGEVTRTMTLYSPYSGVVTSKNAIEGMFVKAGLELLNISDISKVWVNAELYEFELPWVTVGQKARVQLPYDPDTRLEGIITYITPYVKSKTRTVVARLEFPNPDQRLKPDMYVNVELQAESTKDALTIPVEAVLDTGEKQTVFVALGAGKFEPRQIKPGLQDGQGFLEVKQGVFEGESVVTSAQFMLDSESQLREAIRKMLEPKKEEPAVVSGGPDAAEEDLFGDENDQEKLDDLF